MSISDQWEDDRSRFRERYSRGYNPDFYGIDGASSTVSGPAEGDVGYMEEDNKAHPGRMMDRYESYKAVSERAKVDEKAYRDHRSQVPKTNPVRPRPGYYGDQQACTTLPQHHRELGYLARQTSESARSAWQEREEFDRDYIGHYHDNEMRKNHVQFTGKMHKFHNQAEKYNEYHSRYFDEGEESDESDGEIAVRVAPASKYEIIERGHKKGRRHGRRH